MFLHRMCIACMLAFLIVLGNAPVQAADQDISFEADSVSVNQDDGSMLAVGNVELRQAGMTLTADEVRYNRTADRAVANGNVTFIDADGGVHRSEQLFQDSD